MNPVLLDQCILNNAGAIVASHGNALACATADAGVEDVIAANGDVVQVVAEMDTHVDVVDHQIVQRYVRSPTAQLDSVAAVSNDLETTDGEIGRPFNTESVPNRRSGLPGRSRNEDGGCRRTFDVDANPVGFGVGALVNNERIPGPQIPNGVSQNIRSRIDMSGRRGRSQAARRVEGHSC